MNTGAILFCIIEQGFYMKYIKMVYSNFANAILLTKMVKYRTTRQKASRITIII